MEFMMLNFVVYVLCGVGCLLGSVLSAVLLSLILTFRSARRTMDEIVYFVVSVCEEVLDMFVVVCVSGLEFMDVMEEVGELMVDVGGGL